MYYNECVDYIQNASLYGGLKAGLSNIAELLKRLENPHFSLKFVHVAGTNGKGSVCSMMERVLRESGYKTGLFTSPYLEHFTERIRFSGENISEDVFTDIANRVIQQAKKMAEDGYNHPTFFEMVTACAFVAFEQENVDVAVIETGVGGLNDSTNIIDPLVCVITNIGLDHTAVLGSTIEEIARKKAGIIKPGCPVIVYPQDSNLAYTEILMESKKQSAPLYSVADAKLLVQSSGILGQKFQIAYQELTAQLEISLLGRHQILNATTAFIALLVLNQSLGFSKISSNSILSGFKNAKWPGRLEVMHKENPLIIIDGAHNKQAATQLKKELSQLIINQKCILLVGIMSTKDVEGIISELSEFAMAAIATSPIPPKSLPADELKELLQEKIDIVYAQDNVEFALKQAAQLAQKEKAPLIVAGSLYLAGKVRSLLSENLFQFGC